MLIYQLISENCTLKPIPKPHKDPTSSDNYRPIAVVIGSALWRLDSKSISTIEIAFNKVLRHIWNLPANSHTRILYIVLLVLLASLFNTILSRSFSLLRSALACPSFPASYIFRASSGLVYTCVGFNIICGNLYKKVYFSEDMYCANVVRNICLPNSHQSNVELEHIVRVVSSD